jgi:formamidopyrimidine-DNA glycosylase
MPELPEVETTLRGIKPHIIDQKVIDVVVRHPRLRWPIPHDLKKRLVNKTVRKLWRRGKYLLVQFDTGTLIIHLGMSGRLCVLKHTSPPQKHDHVDICFGNHVYLRFTDPRRFGAVLWTNGDPEQHSLLAIMGPEPLSKSFNSTYLFQQSRGKKTPIKSLIMNSAIVTGVGNIYAAEALFTAHIHPELAAGKLTLPRYHLLVNAIKEVLKRAIKKGGTTLKDFTKSDGSPGYFRIELKVYGRGGEPCRRCGTPLTSTRLGQRSTVFCKKCQIK